MFKHRLISTIIIIPCVITTLFLLPILQFKIVTLLICMLSAWEWGKLSNLSPSLQKKWLLLIFIILFTILYMSTNNELLFNSKIYQYAIYIILIWWTTALSLTLFYPHSTIIWSRSTTIWIIFGILMIIPFFWGTLTLRYYCYNENHYIGSWLLLYVITITWGMDSLSYMIGRTLGHNQITPKISPHKTWEGYIGAAIIVIIIFWILSKYIPVDIGSLKLFSYPIIIILSSILGDLTESMFKRTAKVKDSSQLIPGHGGILDAIDSLYSSIPIFSSLILLQNNLNI